MTLKFTNKINQTIEVSGKDVAIMQTKQARLVHELEQLRFEISFLGGIRTKVADALITEEGPELQTLQLTMKEYRTLVLFIPELQKQVDKLTKEKEVLNIDVDELIFVRKNISMSKDSIEKELQNNQRYLNGAVRELNEKYTNKYKEFTGLNEDVIEKKLELDSVLKIIQEEKDELARKRLTLNDFQDFLQDKARDVARMQRKIERHWDKTFPGEKMLFNDERDIMEVEGSILKTDNL